jgi:hypothetical protein
MSALVSHVASRRALYTKTVVWLNYVVVQTFACIGALKTSAETGAKRAPLRHQAGALQTQV